MSGSPHGGLLGAQSYQEGVKDELDVLGLSEVDVVHEQRAGVQLHEDGEQLQRRQRSVTSVHSIRVKRFM